MGFLDKVKNMFIEEVEEDEPIKKEVRQVEIPSPKPQPKPVEQPAQPQRQVIHSQPVQKVERIEPQKRVEPVAPAPVQPTKREEKFVFPVFDDKDFDMIERKVEPKKEPPKPVAPKKEVYKPAPVEKKVFKPTPIISPVYGILDKNYRKEDIKPKKEIPTVTYKDSQHIDIDDIRKKAYGTLEDDLENTLFGKTSVLFEDNNKEEEQKAALDLLSELEDTDEKDREIINSLKEIDEKLRATPKRSDKYRELEKEELEDNLIEAEMNKEYEEPKPEEKIDLNDSDLFNLIDSMYEKKDDE